METTEVGYMVGEKPTELQWLVSGKFTASCEHHMY